MSAKLASLCVLVFAEIIVAFQHPDGKFRGPRVRHEAHNTSSDSPGPCDLTRLEYRLNRLETQMAEKLDGVSAELTRSNQRLRSLEWQSVDVQAALETFRTELVKYMETQQPLHPGSGVSPNLNFDVDNLAKGMTVVITSLRGINADIATIKRNITAIAKNTKNLVVRHNNLVTKPFLTESLIDHRSSSNNQNAQDLPKNCNDLLKRGSNTSGIYRVQPELAPRAFMVLCDMETSGGGWTYIHNRYEGVQDFYLNWHSYKLGFGNLGGEFWLGLEYLHQLTGYEVNELLVELADLDGNRVHAHYSAFSVGTETEGYPLKVLAGYEGNAGDSLIYHAGSKFSTKDVDQDGWAEGSCAQAHNGAWWYRSCDTSNLNGQYLNGELTEDHLYRGMYWKGFHGAQYSLLRARMMVRPRDVSSSESLSEDDLNIY